MADYYNEQYKLHWNPNVERLGLGTLLKKVNHVAIIVSDVNSSLAFYVQVLGFQQIRRPNFDRYGAWLTMGNCELHLIKGVPVVPHGDNLIVPHISVETDSIDAVLEKLTEMKIPFARNVSVPDATESKPITQYFIRDPDGYYIELCNCDILTDFCLGKSKQNNIQYEENVRRVEMSHIFKLAILAQKAMVTVDEDLDSLTPDPSQWAEKADPTKLANMLSRCKIYGDLMQGETEESISSALRKANNNVPLATKIIRARKKGNEVYLPPAFYEQGKERYQPTLYVAPKDTHPTRKTSLSWSAGNSYERIARKMFEHFDKDKNGVLTKDEVRSVLNSLRQNPDDRNFAEIFAREDSNKDGVIDLEEFMKVIQPVDDYEHWQAFFNMLDADGNNKITCPELATVVKQLDLPLHDSHIENMFIDADEDGNGVLSLEEIRNYLLK